MATRAGVAVGVPVRYFLLGENAEKHLELAKERCLETTLPRISLDDELQQLRELMPVLVTGSAGYLGKALVRSLRGVGLEAKGLDLLDADVLGDVAGEVLETAVEGCRSIIHTAALHAPNLDYYEEDEYRRVNVEGTRRVLDVAERLGIPVVFSSTTSLMNTQRVKERTRSEMMVLRATEDYGTPRNIYGVTKKMAEELCRSSQCNVAILRCSRFFAEDAYDTSLPADERSSQLSNGNVKANELLLGTRASLEDMVLCHLASLVKIRTQRLLGPLVISAPSPLAEGQDLAHAQKMYSTFGWSFPVPGRVIDSRETWQSLNRSARWDFQRLLSDFENQENLELIRDGCY